MLSLPVCRWRDDADDGLHVCRSTKFLNAPNRVSAGFCAECYYVDHEAAAVAAPSPPALPCVHLGGRANADGEFACTVHGRCVLQGDGAIHACAGCPDYLARDPFGPGSAQMRAKADAHLAGLPPYPAGRYHGRGVVIAGGGDRYFAALYVTIRALRHVGCGLPIQVWYLGRDDEMPAARQALLVAHDVECVDADEVRQRHPARQLNGWELKVFATLHAPFEEVLFLDADCYPCRNPEMLFEQADYRAAGAIFWPDVAPEDTRLRWPAFGVAGPQRPGSVESGQYVIHKKTCWRPLNLAWFYNDHSDYYYRFCYGDKHTFEVAWTRCAQPYVMWQATTPWLEIAYLHAGPDGSPLFVHRCADKFSTMPQSFATPQFYPGQRYYPRLPLEAECWGWLGDLLKALGADTRKSAGSPEPERIVRIGLPGHFNCSVLEHQGRLLLASRHGQCVGELFLSELDDNFQPQNTQPLAIAHPSATGGVEDPRLFRFRGRLHCAFTGVDSDVAIRCVHQMVARLHDDGRVDEVWLPHYPDRASWEKNWQFFEHAGELYSVYSIQPHLVLHHRADRTHRLATHPFPPIPWCDGHLRGGAPPVRVGHEYYHFFHSVQRVRNRHDYALGLYTFDTRPPFAVGRIATVPLLVPDAHDQPAGLGKRVVFPCGAVLRGGRWLISYGYHDQECRVVVFDAGKIEECLREQPL